jgi:hypothetical protein
MGVDRRAFLGGGLLAGGGFIHAAAAAPAEGRSVTDFGVQPGSESDQTAALQKAIDAISAAGLPVSIPGGRYVTGNLVLPAKCAIYGTPGLTILASKERNAIFESPANEACALYGLTLDGNAKGQARNLTPELISISGGAAQISHCLLQRCPGGGMVVENATGMIHAVVLAQASGVGIWLRKARGMTVSGCDVAETGGEGIKAEGGAEPVLASDNRISRCSTGLSLAGSGVANGNMISGAKSIGLRLGGGSGDGQIVATGNSIQDCAVGIGVVAGGETVLASINLITRPKNGAIRAFDGQKLVGPDLARESAEAYLNLTVAGNVVR